MNDVIEPFLELLHENLAKFASYCEQYMREEVSISDVTRHLSAVTVDAETFFNEQSPLMSMDQLQRYGFISQKFDQLTAELFRTEIKRNKLVIAEAIKNGDYFIVNLSYNSIKSSIFMVYAKSRIKADQDKAIAELQQEQEATQAVIKVLKALERAGQVDEAQPFHYLQFQKALEIYVQYFQSAEVATISACNERVFQIFNQNRQNILAQKSASKSTQGSQEQFKHIFACCDLLLALVKTPQQAEWLKEWRIDFKAPAVKNKQAIEKPLPFYYKYLDTTLLESAREQERAQEQALAQEEEDDLGDWFVD